MKKRIFIYVTFAIASLAVLGAFITATSYAQLAVAILIYPALVYFAFKAFPQKTRIETIKPLEPVASEIQPEAEEAETEEKVIATKRENVGIADIDKRAFLKLIGGAGLTLFLFSIFNKRAEGIFFKNAPATGKVALEDIAGKKIDPAQNQPLDGYTISEVDDDFIAFYGFTNKDGRWFVMREDTYAGSFRYTKGDSNFPINWTNRKNLKYDYYSNIFKA